LAEAFMRQRDLELAKLHLDVALAADANCAHAQFLMGEFYRSKEDYRRCERHLKRAVALDPNVAIVWRTLADVYLRLSQFDAAETAINKAIALQPQQASAHYVRGVVLRKRATTPQEWQRSEEAFQKAAQLSEGDPMQQADAYFDMARIEEERGNEAAAVRLYQRVLRLDPERRQAHYQLAQLYIRQKKQTEADRHLKEFQRLNVTWKRINQLRNRIQQAVTDRETADASLELAQIYVKMNLSNKAIGVLQEVLREQPTHKGAIARLAQILQQTGEGHGSR
jgi:tetratricopeptide (TPR) repeat protein